MDDASFLKGSFIDRNVFNGKNHKRIESTDL